jgi:hypothetical protein
VITDKGTQTIDTAVLVKKIEYPTSSNTSINGNSTLENEYETYTLSYPSSVNGQVSAAWSLEGLEGYAEIVSQDNSSCVIKKLQESAMSEVGTLTCSLSKASGASLFSVTRSIEVVNPDIAETDAGICAALYAAGLCANETYITKIEAAAITWEQLTTDRYQDATSVFYKYRSEVKSFNGFKFFTGITRAFMYMFKNFSNMTSIEFPNSIVTWDDDICSQCDNLERVILPQGMEVIPRSMFYNCYKLKNITIPESVTSIGPMVFNRCYDLDIVIPKNVTSIAWNAYAGCFDTNRITCYCEVAPTLASSSFGEDMSSYTGSSVKNQGLNTLYVPANATGYEEGYWLDPVQNPDKCGFTLSKTL